MTFLFIGLAFGVIAYGATRSYYLAPAFAIVNVIIAWFFLPIFRLDFYGFPMMLAMNAVVIIFLELFLQEKNLKKAMPSITVGALAILWVVIVFISSSAFFHADAYHKLIGGVEDGIFSTDTTPVDVTQVRTVDQTLAIHLADKRLGEDTALGSQVNIGIMRIQLVNGHLYWVAPLNHSGFFKWFSNSKGTPGYVMVSATNERDVKLVQEIEGKKIFLKFNGNNYWENRLGRYLYNRGYLTKGLTDYTFEIDDNGKPYWIVTLYEKTIGFDGKDAVGIVILDAQNGDIKEYSIANAPIWVDRIQPEAMVINQINDWGKYVHGWWNFSDKDKLRTTRGTSLIYGTDKKSYWYTGITSVGADSGTIGFVLVDTRTKKAKLYHQAGATETAAKASAEGAVQEKGYQATFPILYNVSGIPTYFTTLKDNAGLVKLKAWVSVEDYNIVGIGASSKKALRNYRRNLLARGNDLAPDINVSRKSVTGRVLRIGKNELNFYFLIKGSENKLFVGSHDISPEIVITNVGDSISVQYDDGGSEIVDIAYFDNLAIDLQKTSNQLEVDERAKKVVTEKSNKRVGQNADASWEKLTPEKKKELLKK